MFMPILWLINWMWLLCSFRSFSTMHTAYKPDRNRCRLVTKLKTCLNIAVWCFRSAECVVKFCCCCLLTVLRHRSHVCVCLHALPLFEMVIHGELRAHTAHVYPNGERVLSICAINDRSPIVYDVRTKARVKAISDMIEHLIYALFKVYYSTVLATLCVCVLDDMTQ